MTYRTQTHDDWRGKDGTAFMLREPGGDWTYIYAGSDRGNCHYETLTCRPGFSISRWNAAQAIRQARARGLDVSAVRYVQQAQP